MFYAIALLELRFTSKKKIYDLLQAEIDERRANRELSGNDVLSLITSDRPIFPKRRGATIAPDNGVPLTLNGRRSRTKKNLAMADF